MIACFSSCAVLSTNIGTVTITYQKSTLLCLVLSDIIIDRIYLHITFISVLLPLLFLV